MADYVHTNLRSWNASHLHFTVALLLQNCLLYVQTIREGALEASVDTEMILSKHRTTTLSAPAVAQLVH